MDRMLISHYVYAENKSGIERKKHVYSRCASFCLINRRRFVISRNNQRHSADLIGWWEITINGNYHFEMPYMWSSPGCLRVWKTIHSIHSYFLHRAAIIARANGGMHWLLFFFTAVTPCMIQPKIQCEQSRSCRFLGDGSTDKMSSFDISVTSRILTLNTKYKYVLMSSTKINWILITHPSSFVYNNVLRFIHCHDVVAPLKIFKMQRMAWQHMNQYSCTANSLAYKCARKGVCVRAGESVSEARQRQQIARFIYYAAHKWASAFWSWEYCMDQRNRWRIVE